MNATYGRRRVGHRKASLPPPYTSYAHPVPPEKVYGDYSPFCPGCPYPRHGLLCFSKDGGGCLRTDMLALEKKGRAEREAAANADAQITPPALLDIDFADRLRYSV